MYDAKTNKSHEIIEFGVKKLLKKHIDQCQTFLVTNLNLGHEIAKTGLNKN